MGHGISQDTRRACRIHRCVRIIFTMNFHLGFWAPQQCVDFLVNDVGYERDHAGAEVRRSFNGSVPELYQSAYLLGALQFRALRAELVSNRDFHDAILRENQMPIEMPRAILTNEKLDRTFHTSWKFYGAIPALPWVRLPGSSVGQRNSTIVVKIHD